MACEALNELPSAHFFWPSHWASFKAWKSLSSFLPAGSSPGSFPSLKKLLLSEPRNALLLGLRSDLGATPSAEIKTPSYSLLCKNTLLTSQQKCFCELGIQT